jgi:hypothetical protein
MLTQLMEDITTIESSAALLATETSRMARRANIDIIKAQAGRASWLLRAKTMLEGPHRTHFRPRPLAFLLGQVRNGLAAECRLNGVTVNVQASDWNAVVNVDEVGLIVGLTGAALATFGIVGQGEGSVITMSAEAFNGELRAVEVSQDDVMATPILTGRFFDSTWLERPGGWTAGIGAATAKAVSQQHGGDAAFVAGERSGSTLRLTLNRASWFESEWPSAEWRRVWSIVMQAPRPCRHLRTAGPTHEDLHVRHDASRRHSRRSRRALGGRQAADRAEAR